MVPQPSLKSKLRDLAMVGRNYEECKRLVAVEFNHWVRLWEKGLQVRSGHIGHRSPSQFGTTLPYLSEQVLLVVALKEPSST